MGMMRSALLAGSQSVWLREHATRWPFVKRAVRKFMPGEELADALGVAKVLEASGIGTVVTKLGENVIDRAEASVMTGHYLETLDRAKAQGLKTEVSVKLTQMGLDLDLEFCYENLEKVVKAAPNVVWIDMEYSHYVDSTLKLYRRALEKFENVGVCLQAYLYRTDDDLASLLPLKPAIRLVKGAYAESAEIAFPKKADVDENYFALSRKMLDAGCRTVIATHDRSLIARIEALGHAKKSYAFTMLYGIQTGEQTRLMKDGHDSRVLVAYGDYWFPWYMRRLAERPANLWFVAKNLAN